MSEDRWDLASLSPLTSLSGSSSTGNPALPLPDRDHVKTSTPDGGSALSGLNRSVGIVRIRPPLRIPPRHNPARRARAPRPQKDTASRRSPSPSEDERNYSDGGSEWGGIAEDYASNPSVPLLRLDGTSSPSFGHGPSPRFGLEHQDEDWPMGSGAGASAQCWPTTPERPADPPNQPTAEMSAPCPMSESPEAPAQDSPPEPPSPPILQIPVHHSVSQILETPALRSPGHHSIPLSPEPPADRSITKSPQTPAPSSPALSIPTSPTHISVWESPPPPDVYRDLPITCREMISSVSQRHHYALPSIPVTSTPLSHQRNPGDGPPSPAYSDANVVPPLDELSASSSVQILHDQYQALYEEWVDLATMQAMMERQLEHLGGAADLNEATFA